MRVVRWGVAMALAFAVSARAAEFGTPGGPEPSNLGEIEAVLGRVPHDLELLLTFGTSKGGSAGHLALAIRGREPGVETVWSANFYADRDPKHARDRLTGDLMLAIPKREYLYGTRSSLGDKASFGLDYGEVYKRSVIGVRVRGVPERERRALEEFFARVNTDFQRRAKDTAYHDGEVKYDYLRLNCAKTIGAAFRHGAGYEDLEVTAARFLPRRRIAAALNANIPTEMALKLLAAWHARGYAMETVFYRKYAGSPWVDPLEEEKVAFRDLPNRFPSVLSRDFRREAGEYEDYDNLFAMYLFYNLARHGVRIDGPARRLEIERTKEPLAYPEAARLAAASAGSDSERYGRREAFRPEGTRIGELPAGSGADEGR
jgi:hypothetical protein